MVFGSFWFFLMCFLSFMHIYQCFLVLIVALMHLPNIYEHLWKTKTQAPWPPLLFGSDPTVSEKTLRRTCSRDVFSTFQSPEFPSWTTALEQSIISSTYPTKEEPDGCCQSLAQLTLLASRRLAAALLRNYALGQQGGCGVSAHVFHSPELRTA